MSNDNGQINTFTLSKKWFEFSFQNTDKVKPIHTAIYFYAIEHCNSLGWKEKFGFPTSLVMEVIGVKNYKTYIKGLNDLVEWGFLDMVQKSKNQYSSNVIALVKNTKAHTKALSKARPKHIPKQAQSTVSINKPINLLTNKLDNSENQQFSQQELKEKFEEFRKSYPGRKRGLETEITNLKKKHKDWKEVIPKLLENLNSQKSQREQQKQKSQFVPEWKNLQTWINQRCWEEEQGAQSENGESVTDQEIPEFFVVDSRNNGPDFKVPYYPDGLEMGKPFFEMIHRIDKKSSDEFIRRLKTHKEDFGELYREVYRYTWRNFVSTLNAVAS